MSENENAAIRELSRSIEQLTESIAGNTKLGIEGMVKAQRRQDVDILELQKWRQKMQMKIAFYSGIATTVVLIAGKIYDRIIPHLKP